MSFRLNVLLAVAGVLALAPAASAAQEEVRIVVVYDPTQLPHDHYTVVRRLGMEGRPWWRRMPAYRDYASARRALVEEAGRMGADGLINLYCVNKADGAIPREGYFCYANAIKLHVHSPVETMPLR